MYAAHISHCNQLTFLLFPNFFLWDGIVDFYDKPAVFSRFYYSNQVKTARVTTKRIKIHMFTGAEHSNRKVKRNGCNENKKNMIFAAYTVKLTTNCLTMLVRTNMLNMQRARLSALPSVHEWSSNICIHLCWVLCKRVYVGVILWTALYIVYEEMCDGRRGKKAIEATTTTQIVAVSSLYVVVWLAFWCYMQQEMLQFIPSFCRICDK